MFCTEVLKLHEPQFWNNIGYLNTELFGKWNLKNLGSFIKTKSKP